MESYTRLFSGIVRSTIWDESHTVRIVWVTMLALSDREGVVYGSVPGLSHEARVTVLECQEALEHLSSPDPHSRTDEDEGRRIRVVDGGWLLLNHEKYRALGGGQEANRQRQARFRQRRKDQLDTVTLPVTPVTVGDGESPPAPAPSPAPEKKEVSRAAHARPVVGEDHPAFADWYDAYPRHIGRASAARAYQKAIGKLGDFKGQRVLFEGAEAFAVYCKTTARPLDKTPYPSTWLNQQRWEDNYAEQADAELRSSTETRHDHRSDKAAGEHDEPDTPVPTL